MEQKFLRKGKKIIVGNEEFTLDDFKNVRNFDNLSSISEHPKNLSKKQDGFFDEENFNEELGEGVRNREIVMSSGDKDNPKMVKQKIFAKKGKNSMHIGAYREVSQANKFKNGFSYQSQKVFVSKSMFGGNKKD